MNPNILVISDSPPPQPHPHPHPQLQQSQATANTDANTTMATAHFSRGPPPAFNLAVPAPLLPFNKSVSQWLLDNDKHFDGLAVGALVFSPSPSTSSSSSSSSSSPSGASDDNEDRILLVQRAAHDSMPNLWETPGGAADPTDATLLEAAARELWEETGLRAGAVVRVVTEGAGSVPGSVFTNRTGRLMLCRFSFEVEVEVVEGEGEGGAGGGPGVSVDPAEHQDYVWATEGEVRGGRARGKDIQITNRQMKALILEGFRLRRGDKEGGRGGGKRHGGARR